jgi:hypothetical protein
MIRKLSQSSKESKSNHSETECDDKSYQTSACSVTSISYLDIYSNGHKSHFSYNRFSEGVASNETVIVLNHPRENFKKRKQSTYDFNLSFVGAVPVFETYSTEIKFEDFTDAVFLCDGSNSNIFTSRHHDDGRKVVLKLLKEEKLTDTVAIREFKLEGDILFRLNHENIVNVIGIGKGPIEGVEDAPPRPMIVLERLENGVLTKYLKPNAFDRPHFSYKRGLRICIEFACALDYLHHSFHSDFKVIHRDLKPDNLGFTSSGVVKLLDFGLCTVIPKSENVDEVYELTGGTGSMRYMAPEVARNEKYNEKVMGK